jgi:histone deacetylase HOS3
MSSSSSQGVHDGEKAAVAVFLQADCCQHRYDSREGSEDIFELPERLQSVNLGLAAALARLSEVSPSHPKNVCHILPSGRFVDSVDDSDVIVVLRLTDDLPRGVKATNKSDRLYFEGLNLTLVQNATRKDVLDDEAIDWVHPKSYLENIRKWAQASTLPESISGSDLWRKKTDSLSFLSSADLCLCPVCSDSFKAIRSAVAAVSEAVDSVMVSRPVVSKPVSKGRVHDTPSVKAPRAFVSVRPPGHHCNGSVPAGFCWVNNVAIAAAQGTSVNQVLFSDLCPT